MHGASHFTIRIAASLLKAIRHYCIYWNYRGSGGDVDCKTTIGDPRAGFGGSPVAAGITPAFTDAGGHHNMSPRVVALPLAGSTRSFEPDISG